MRRRCFVWILGLLIFAGCRGSKAPTTISLDFPHGEARLLVRRGRDAQLYYGALPTSCSVPQEVFDIDELFSQLQPRLHEVVPSEERPFDGPYGMVTLGFGSGDPESYLIYDAAYAVDLLNRACDHRARQTDPAEALFEQVCADLKALKTPCR
jgi:hypothetical protein